MMIGGWLASMPVSGGPILLFYALEQGTPFAAQAAHFSVISVLGVASYCVVYGWVARRFRWWICLACAWVTFFLTVWLLRGLPIALLPAVGVTLLGLIVGRRLLPGIRAQAAPRPPPRWDLPLRLVAALTLVLSLTYLATWLGPTWSGLFTAFPVASAVVGAFSHAQQGPDAAIGFFRGMLGGMHGFCLFCAVLAITLVPYGTLAGFLLAIAAQLMVQGLGLWMMRRAKSAAAVK
jgi:hypothetical protein